MLKCIVAGLGFACLLYIVVGYTGYFQFIKIKDAAWHTNVLLNDYRGDTMIVVAAIGLCLVFMLSTPLFIQATRRNFEHLLLDEDDETSESFIGGRDEIGCRTPILFYAKSRTGSIGTIASDRSSHGESKPQLSKWQYWTITLS